MAALKSLNKNDITELKALTRPPDGVRLVIETVCIMKKVAPKKVAGDKVIKRCMIILSYYIYNILQQL